MDELTDRQRAILDFVAQCIDAGLPPTLAEIAGAFGIRHACGVTKHMKALEAKGYLALTPGTARGMRLLAPTGLPVIGRVAAGQPILAEAHIERHVRVDTVLFRPRADYLLRVKGASMCGAGILDGDLIAVHRTPEARNGQIVVARLGEEVTVKRLQRNGRHVQLLPENPEFAPIEVDPKAPFAIEGLYVGLLRGAT